MNIFITIQLYAYLIENTNTYERSVHMKKGIIAVIAVVAALLAAVGICNRRKADRIVIVNRKRDERK